MSHASARRGKTAALLVLVLTAGLLIVPTAADAAEVSIAPVRQVGAPGHADLYGWGMATAIDGSILIGDYWNFRVERYGADGTYLGTVISNQGTGETQHQTPYGLAVDPNNGDIVFGDVDGMQLPSATELFGYGVDKYTADGTYLTSWGTKYAWGEPEVGTFAYPSYVAVASTGNVYVTDQRRHNVVAHTPDGIELFQIGDNAAGTGPGQFKQPRGIAFDAQDRLFVADNANQRIQVFEADGTYLYEFGEPGPGPGQLGNDMRQIAIDQANEWLYVVDTTQGMTSKFALDGTYLTRWGGWGNAPGKFVAGGRGVTVDHDGNVWVGDMGGFRAQKFDPDGNFLLQVPEAPTAPPDGGFNQPRGVALGPDGDIFVTDTHNWRVQRFNGDGSFNSAFGTRGSDDYKFNYPRGISIDPTDGSIVVADTDNHRIKKYSNDGVFLWELGGYGPGDGQFKTPHSVDVGPDGTIYVADSLNQRVVMLDPAGAVIGSFGSKGSGDGQHQFVRGVDFDETDGTVWLTDSVRGRVNHWNVDGTWLGAFGAVGDEDHQLLRAADLEADATYVYVADSDTDRIKVWRKDGTFVGAFTGGPGETQLQRPHGLDLVGDRLYVVEQTGERVQEFLITTGGEPDTTPPDAVVTVPGPGDLFPIAPLTIAGTANDDVAVAAVRVAVRDKAGGQWWTGAGWGAFTYLSAELADPGEPTTAWTLEWLPPGAGDYAVLVEARDSAANPDPSKPWVSFTVYPGALDVTEPDATITVPAKGGSYPDASLQLAGVATDDASGVAAVAVGIKDTATGQWWDGTDWTASFTFNAANVDSVGATTTGWSYDWLPPGPGSYGALVRTTDIAGNVDSTKPWHGFTIVASGADVDAPEVTIVSPAKGSTQPFVPVLITGEAADATSGVAVVDVAIKNTATSEWWDGAGWVGSFTYLPTTLGDPGSQTTNWSMTWDPPSPGSYGVMARVIDVAGNINPVKPWHGFTIEQ